MAVVVGEAAVAIRPETTGFAGNAEQGVLNPLGDIAKKAAVLMGGIFVGKEIVGGLKSFYDAAAESAKIGALTQQVITSTGGAAQLTADQVGDLVTKISNKTGVDDEAIQSGANLLLTFTNIKDAAGDGNDIFTQTTQIMTDMSAALGTDASGSAIQLGKALNDPVKGISALSKVGVSFTQQQKDQVAAMVAAGDTMGAQRLILGELNKEFGGAAEAASTPLDKLQVNLGNVQEALGANLLPVVANVSTYIVDNLLPAFDQLTGIVEQAFNILFSGDFTGGPLSEDSGVVDTLFNIRDGFIQFKDSVVAFVQGDTFAAWVQIAKDAGAALWQGLQTLAGFVTGTLVPAFVTVVETIGQVAEYFRQHQTAAEALGIAVGIVAALVVAAWTIQTAAAVAGSISSVISWFAVAVGAQAAAEGTTLSTAQIVFGWIASAAAAVVNAAIVVASWVLMGAQALLAAARMAAAWFIALGPVGWVIAAVVGLVALIVANWDTVVSWTTTAWTAVTAAVSAAWEWIKGAVSAALQFVVDIFMNWTLLGLIISHWETIKSTFSAGVDAAIGFVTGLPQRALDALANLGAMIAGAAVAAWDWYNQNVNTKINEFIGWVLGIPGRAASALAGLGGAIAGAAVAAWNWYNENVNSKIREGIDYIAGIPGRAVSALGNLGSSLYQKGVDLIQGLINGVKSLAGTIGSAFLNLVPSWIRGPLERALGISSPSKVFHDYGVSIGQGLVNGIQSMQPQVEAAAAALANAPMVGAARELLDYINRGGGAVFEDLSYRGMSQLLSDYNDQLADLFSVSGRADTQAGMADFLNEFIQTGGGGVALSAVNESTDAYKPGVIINVHPSQGMNEQTLAQAVSRETMWQLGTGGTRTVPVTA